MGFFKLAYLSSMNKLCTFECGFCLQGKSISIPIVLFAKCLISFTQQQMFLPGRRFLTKPIHTDSGIFLSFVDFSEAKYS